MLDEHKLLAWLYKDDTTNRDRLESFKNKKENHHLYMFNLGRSSLVTAIEEEIRKGTFNKKASE